MSLLIRILIHFILPIKTDETACKEKWVGYKGKCFYGFAATEMHHASLAAISNTCRAIGGQLATVDNEDVNTVLYDYLSGQYVKQQGHLNHTAYFSQSLV